MALPGIDITLGPATKGYVHVMDRRKFTLRGGSEWLSLEPISVAGKDIIEVRWSDFEQPIDVIGHEL